MTLYRSNFTALIQLILRLYYQQNRPTPLTAIYTMQTIQYVVRNVHMSIGVQMELYSVDPQHKSFMTQLYLTAYCSLSTSRTNKQW